MITATIHMDRSTNITDTTDSTILPNNTHAPVKKHRTLRGWGKRAPREIRWYLDHSIELSEEDQQIVKTFKKLFVKAMVENPEGVTLPGELGFLKIVGMRLPGNAKGGKRYHNLHSSGWTFKATWYSQVVYAKEDITRPAFEESDLYNFSPCEHLSQAMVQQIKAGNYHFYHARSWTRAPRMYGTKRGRPTQLAGAPSGVEKIPQEDGTIKYINRRNGKELTPYTEKYKHIWELKAKSRTRVKDPAKGNTTTDEAIAIQEILATQGTEKSMELIKEYIAVFGDDLKICQVLDSMITGGIVKRSVIEDIVRSPEFDDYHLLSPYREGNKDEQT